MKYLVNWPLSPPSLLVWVAFFVTFPFYTFSSGLPQPADLLMAVLIIYSLARRFFSDGFTLRPELVPFLLLVGYSFFVTSLTIPSISVSGFSATLQFLFPVFFLYNFCVVMIAGDLYTRFGKRFLELTMVGIILSLFLQVILLPVGLSGNTRSSLFFNNPNQLGYYILLIMTLFFYMDRVLRPPIVLKIGVVLCGFLIAYFSLSKAAIVSSVVLVVVNLVDAGYKNPKQLFGGVAAILILSAVLLGTPFGTAMLETTLEQLAAIGEGSDENLEGRGYDRITLFPHYVLFGAGEGGYGRFYDDVSRHYELHSSFGTLLFSYGIPGSFFFIWFVFRTFKRSTITEMLYAVPVFAYGVTHMGLRFTLFWIFFSVVATINDYKVSEKVAQRRASVAKRLSVSTVSSSLPLGEAV